ncbi:bifunctional metallophosphatase/5'-nucleotidase [Ferviditalea candida]|uniref:Bifunctional UDP-sugar hydrolase/5'-nucleotidase n=1 Tax=Ferviditalea candida TaxID=3108399 RepID=A0ABU5ZIR7_9BACL|nr:bifunctional UDP-sugar hydrolase/5'-nucleotidase [Paenibacillaceae bacterium T2]
MRQRLVILHTNDIHSFFEQMPKIFTALHTIRQRCKPQEVLTIDCGDHMDRMRMETEGSDGLANVEIMNATGYEFAVLGNNEGLTYTPEVLRQCYEAHARFKVIGSNMALAETGEPPSWMVPYQIVCKGSIKVGLIGVTADYTDFYSRLGWDVSDPFETVADLVKQLRGQVHLLVVISHLGLGNDKRMAEEIPGIDCILGGHTHHLLEEPLRIGSTAICAAGKFGEYVGWVEWEYEFDTARLTFGDGGCVAVNSYEDDARIVQIVEHFHALGKTTLNEPIVVLDKSLSNGWDRESELGNLLAEGLKVWTDAEVGIVNAGQILAHLDSGIITREKLLEICPSPINPCSLWLSGDQIWAALEESLIPEFIGKPIRGFGFRGKVLGTLCLDGITVEYDSAAPAYQKIRSVLINRQPIDRSREYRVGTIDMFTFGVGYSTLGKGRDTDYVLPEFIRDVLRGQLLDAEAIGRSSMQRWMKT